MATVLISNRFIDDVRNLVDGLMNDDVKFKCGTELGKVSLAHIKTPLRYLESVAWMPEYAHYATSMPQRWKKQSNRMDFRVAMTRSDGVNVRLGLSAVDLNDATWFPPDFGPYHDHDITLDELKAAAANPDYPEAALLLDAFTKKERSVELELKWRTTREEVIKYFTACPSVNKAIMLNPAMKMYVPKQYLKRLEQPAPTKTKREIPQIDVGQLAAHAVEVSIARSINQGGTQ